MLFSFMSTAQVHAQANVYPWMKPLGQSICKYLNEGYSMFDAGAKAAIDNMTDSLPHDIREMQAKGIYLKSVMDVVYPVCPDAFLEAAKKEQAEKEQELKKNVR